MNSQVSWGLGWQGLLNGTKCSSLNCHLLLGLVSPVQELAKMRSSTGLIFRCQRGWMHSVIKKVNEHHLGPKGELRTITGYTTCKSPVGYSRMSLLNVWTCQIGQKWSKTQIWLLLYKTSSLTLRTMHLLSEVANSVLNFAAFWQGMHFFLDQFFWINRLRR